MQFDFKIDDFSHKIHSKKDSETYFLNGIINHMAVNKMLQISARTTQIP